MKITVNGEQKEFTACSSSETIIAILKLLKYKPELVVVELNGLIVSPTKWNKKLIKNQDRLEIVTIVGGG